MKIAPKKHSLKRLYQILGILLLCLTLVYSSYRVTTAWFMDDSVTSNGEPNIMVIGTVDLEVKTDFNFYNLVLAPDTYYTTYIENGETRYHGTYIKTSEKNDVKSIYVRAKFETNRDELTLYFDGNITTNTTYNADLDLNKWYYHTDGYYYFIGSVGTEEIEFNAGYHTDNTFINAKSYEDVTLELVFESIQRPYGAYKAVWEGAPDIFNEFALADSGV